MVFDNGNTQLAIASDTPKEPMSLSSFDACQARETRLQDAHIAPLTAFVRDLRSNKGPGFKIPYFDPLDGGTGAEVLFLLEAPGPKAVRSGFVSRDNPDRTAENLFKFAAAIPRKHTVIWNIVPWYIGYGSTIRPAKADDIHAGLACLTPVLELLIGLRAIVLVGRKAQMVEDSVKRLRPLALFRCPHPSPQFVNRALEHADQISTVLAKVSGFLQAPVGR